MSIIFLPVVLVLSFLPSASLPPMHLARFKSESDCLVALERVTVLQKRTRAAIVLTCVVDEA